MKETCELRLYETSRQELNVTSTQRLNNTERSTIVLKSVNLLVGTYPTSTSTIYVLNQLSRTQNAKVRHYCKKYLNK